MVFDRQYDPHDGHATSRRAHPAGFLERAAGFGGRAGEGPAAGEPGRARTLDLPVKLTGDCRGPRVGDFRPAEKRGSSCTQRELWNNLIAPRALILQVSPRVRRLVWGVVRTWRERSDDWKSCDASNGVRQEQRAVSRRARESNGIRWMKLRRIAMRNWCAGLVMSALLALPLCAQQKSTGTGDDTANAAAIVEKSANSSNAAGGSNAAASSKTVGMKGVFALPATPRPTPFPGGTPPQSMDTDAPGRLVPRYEITGMYDYINFAPGDPFGNFNSQGGTAAFTYNASKWVGLTGEFGAYDFKRNLFPVTGSNGDVNGSFVTFLFGPRLNLRKFDHFVPFGEFLVGGSRGGIELVGVDSRTAFAIAVGGGVDMVFHKNFAWRVAELDYLMTTFTGANLGSSGRQNNFRAATGLVFRFGIPNPPPPPNHPPVAACSVNPASVFAGSGDSVAVHVTASDPDNDPLTYSYISTGGKIVGSGSNVQLDSTGLPPGTYTVKCTVNDGRGGTADASGNVEVKEPPQIKQLEAKLALHSIYFPTAQPSVAKPTGGLVLSQAATLDELAANFKQYLTFKPDAKLILEGHADVRGAKDYNVKLSERRVERTKSYLVEKGVPADHLETKAFGFEKNMTSEEVTKLIQAEPDLSPAEKQKILKNLLTVRLANNRRVDVTLSTTGEQSVRRFPFSAKDALTLLSRGGSETPKKKSVAPAPEKKAKP